MALSSWRALGLRTACFSRSAEFLRPDCAEPLLSSPADAAGQVTRLHACPDLRVTAARSGMTVPRSATNCVPLQYHGNHLYFSISKPRTPGGDALARARPLCQGRGRAGGTSLASRSGRPVFTSQPSEPPKCESEEGETARASDFQVSW